MKEADATRTSDEAYDVAEAVALVASALDPAYYQEQLRGEAVKDFARHYVDDGWRRFLNPNPAFSTRFYLACYSDALLPDREPFTHYLRHGQAAGWPANHSALNRRALEMGDAFDVISPNLEREYYVRQFPSLRGTTINAAQHYLVYGEGRGLEPSSSFSTQYYLSHSPDVARSGIMPYLHYVKWGRLEGRRSHPAERPWSQRRLTESEIVAGEYFDREYYLAQHPEIADNKVDPLKHYLAFGWRMGWDPRPDFSVEYYLSRSPDVQRANAEPLFHYLKWGRREGRKAALHSQERLPPLTRDERLIARAFDPEFYLSAYPRVAETNIDPLRHFIHFGWDQKLDPNAEFSTRYYAACDPELTAAGVNPFLHYLQAGQAEGRLPRPLDLTGEETDYFEGQFARRVMEAEFDALHYCAQRPELGQEEAFEHFLTLGWREGTDPAPWFSCSEYLLMYPGVLKCAVNPFLHYLAWGKSRGFRPLLPIYGGQPAAASEYVSLADYTEVSRTSSDDPFNQDKDHAVLQASRLKIDWLLSNFAGAGRAERITVFRIVRWLEMLGHACTIWIDNADPDVTPAQVLDQVLRTYGLVKAEIRPLSHEPTFDPDAVVVATDRDSAAVFRRARGGGARMYLVQDGANGFSPAEAWSSPGPMADLDLGYLSTDPWIQARLTERGAWARTVPLGVDPVYTQAAKRPDNVLPRIALFRDEHGQDSSLAPALLALERLAASGVAFQVDVFGSPLRWTQARFPLIDHGVLAPGALARLYQDCDVGLFVSATHRSAPLEMMACGLPTVVLDNDNARAIYPTGTVLLAAGSPEGLGEAIRRLLETTAERREQAAPAALWAQDQTWERAARAVERSILDRAKHCAVTVAEAQRTERDPAPVASVLLHTLDGGPVFRSVLAQVLRQRTPWSFEVVVVDGGSSDGTWEHLQSLGGAVNAVQINPTAFRDPGVRNWAIEQTRGAFIVLLGQDALPADLDWLYNLVETLGRYPNAAGAFGRQQPWLDASEATKREINDRFSSLDGVPLQLTKFTDPARWRSGDVAWWRTLRFFSEMNACLRRSVWRRIPYPESDFGADQLWAAHVVAAGYGKVYAPGAVVYHSRELTETTAFDLARREAAFLLEVFGEDVGPSDVALCVRRLDADSEAWGCRSGATIAEIDRAKQLNASKVAGLAAGVNGLTDDAGQTNPGSPVQPL